MGFLHNVVGSLKLCTLWGCGALARKVCVPARAPKARSPWRVGGEAPWEPSDFKHTYMQFVSYSLTKTLQFHNVNSNL